jgi:WD40 repeat protein
MAPDAHGFHGINATGDLRSWNARGQPQALAATPFTSMVFVHRVAAFDISPDGHRLAAVAPFVLETLSLDGLSATSPLVTATESGVPDQIHFAPDGASVMTIDTGAVIEWGALDARRRRTFSKDPMAIDVREARYSPDGALLVVGGPVLDVWRRSDGTLVRRLQAETQTGALEAVAFSPSGATLATCDTGGTLSLWDTATWTVPLSSRPYALPGTVRCRVAFTPDGKGVVTWSDGDMAVRLWSAADLSPITGMPAYGLSTFVGVASDSGGQQIVGVAMGDARTTFLYCLPPVP